jgi:hypothetical protein
MTVAMLAVTKLSEKIKIAKKNQRPTTSTGQVLDKPALNERPHDLCGSLPIGHLFLPSS